MAATGKQYYWEGTWMGRAEELQEVDDGLVEWGFQKRKNPTIDDTPATDTVTINLSGVELVADLRNLTLYTEDSRIAREAAERAERDIEIEIGSIRRICKPSLPYDPELYMDVRAYRGLNFVFRAAWRCQDGWQGYCQEESDKIVNYLLAPITEEREKELEKGVSINGIHGFRMTGRTEGAAAQYWQYRLDSPAKAREIRFFGFKWQFHCSSSSVQLLYEVVANECDWSDYSPGNSLICENKYLEGASSTTITSRDLEYTVDFYTEHQYQSKSHFYRRKIRRVGCELLKQYLPLQTEPSYPYYWPPRAAIPQAEHIPGQAPPPLQFVKLPDSIEYNPIRDHIKGLMRNMGSHGSGRGLVPGTRLQPDELEIVCIEINSNTILYRNYFFKKSEIPTPPPGDTVTRRLREILQPPEKHPMELETHKNEYYLFHGLPVGSIDPICRGNFNFRRSAQSSMFGRGTYLTDLASKSNQYVNCPVCERGSITTEHCICEENTDRHVYRMLLCRVIFNKCLIVDDWMHQDLSDCDEFLTNPPETQPQKYDSLVFQPGEWVPRNSSRTVSQQSTLQYREMVFCGHEGEKCIFPEFVIHYRRKNTSGSPSRVSQPPLNTSLKSPSSH